MNKNTINGLFILFGEEIKLKYYTRNGKNSHL
jgi:hypothetical protein